MAGMVGAAAQGDATHEAEGDREADDALADDSTRPVIGGPLINMDFSMGRHDWQRILMHLVIMPASAPVTYGHATDEVDGELPMAGRCHWWRRYLQYVYGEPFNDESLDLPLPSPSDLDVLYHWPATQIAAQRAPPQAARVGDRVGDGVGDRVSGGVGDDQSREASPATSPAENSAMLAVATTQEVAAATTGPQLAPEPLQPPRCPLSSPTTGYLEPYLGRVVHAPREAVWLARPAPFTPVADGSWVEVTHCGGGWNEKHGHWMYVARGSGLYVNVGRTIAFGSHEESVRRFLGTACRGPLWCHYGNCLQQCDDELGRMSLAAREAGFDSVQFVSHCDMRCNLCGHELVFVGIEGTQVCSSSITYRQGLHAARSCQCKPSAVWTSERGPCASCAAEDTA